MSVSFTVVLPAAPGTGVSTYVPLGGDGFSAPHSAWSLSSMVLAGDATGGLSTMDITLDDRFTSLVSFLAPQINQAAEADTVAQVRVVGGSSPSIVENIVMIAAPVTSDCAALWMPPAWICPGGAQVCTASAVVPNVNGDTQVLSALIYQFDIRAREQTPVSILNWARGSIN